MKKLLLTGLTAAMLSSGAFASEVTAGTDTTTFSASTPAVAAEVNANFAALIAAINDNNDRIAALESGGLPDLTTVISGSTYKVFYMGGILSDYADSLSPYTEARVERFGGNTLLTFHEDGTLSELINESGREVNLEKLSNCDEFGNGCEHNIEDFDDVNAASGPGGMWSVSGQVLTVLWPGDSPGDEEEFMLNSNGSMIVLGGSGREEETDEFGTQTKLETFLAVGIKLPTVD